MMQFHVVSAIGYQALDALARRRPDLFTMPNTDKLKAEMQKVVTADNQDRLWAEPMTLATSLEPLNDNPNEGPLDDAKNAAILFAALPKLGVRDWHNERLWASINCFALDQYVPIRWNSARTKRTIEREFVATHWLRANTAKQGSPMPACDSSPCTPLSQRFAAYSVHTAAELLEGMAGSGDTNVGLFHQCLRRPYLLANSKVMAMLWDAALEDEDRGFLTRTVPASNWMANINERGGAIDLGTLDDETLRSIVEEAKPRPKGPSHHTQP